MSGTENGEVDLALMDEVFDKYAGQQGVLIPVLQAAQTAYGYLPGEVLKLIADRLEVSLGKVYGVATFYTQFYLERRGRHVLKVCDGTACHVKGTPTLMTAIKDDFGIDSGETTGDGELTMEVVYCLGSCAMAPVAVLDKQVMGRMQAEMLVRRVKEYIASAQQAREI